MLAHQQSVRENRSRFGAILTGSSHQQAGRKRGPGRAQCSRGPPPTPAPVPQPRPPPPRTGGAAPRTGKFRKLAPTFSFPNKEKNKDRSTERQYMVPKERYSLGHLRPTLVARPSMLPLSPPQPGGCRVAVGRRVHMASGSPASKKRRSLEPRGRIRDSLHEPVDAAACTDPLVPHIKGEETGPRAVATACGQRIRIGAAAGRLAPCSAVTSTTSRQIGRAHV